MIRGYHLFRELAVVISLFASLAFQGCSQTADVATASPSSTITMPVRLASSADFGCLRSDSGPLSRIVEIRNSSDAVVHISRWTVSCECLTIEPSSIDVQPTKSAYVRLAFDPTREGNGFVGNLRMSIDGFEDTCHVCTFEVPASVIASEDVKHLDGLRE